MIPPDGPLQSLALVTLVVPDYTPALAFYVDTLGFDLIEDIPQPPKRWVVIAPPGGQGARILLARAVDNAQRRAIGNQTGGRVAFFLTTDNFDRDFVAMTRAGVSFLEAPRTEPYGRVVQWQDPFGNRWDLLQPA